MIEHPAHTGAGGNPHAPWNHRPTPLACSNVDCDATADGDADPYDEGDTCDECGTGRFEYIEPEQDDRDD